MTWLTDAAEGAALVGTLAVLALLRSLLQEDIGW